MRFSDHDLAMYLLGTGLTPHEREQIEEAYFRDDEIFRRAEELELEIVDAYASGQLPEADRESVSRLINRSTKLQEHAGFARALRMAALRSGERERMLTRAWRFIWSPPPLWLSASAAILLMVAGFIGGMSVSRWTEGGVLHQAIPAYVGPSSQDVALKIAQSVALRRTTTFARFILPATFSHCSDLMVSISDVGRNKAVPQDHITIVLGHALLDQMAQGKDFRPQSSSSSLHEPMSVIVPVYYLSPGAWVLSLSARCGRAGSGLTDYAITVTE